MAKDGLADSNVATVTILVTVVNDAPVVANPLDDVTVDEDAAPTVIDLSSVFADGDGHGNATGVFFSAGGG